MSEVSSSAQEAGSSAAPSGKRPAWHLQAALVLIVSCEFMLQLDTTIVNVALPNIESELGFTLAGLSWVTNAFLLAFGGLLLLGGRLGDLVGHRRVFLWGTALFTLASLVGGLAVDDAVLIAARAGQGVGAALAAPTGLALLALTFRADAARNRAFAIYSTVSGTGLALGLVLGGVLTATLSWRWVLIINVPVGALVLLLAPRFIDPSPRHRGRFDLAGALLSVTSTSLLVYALIAAAEAGWVAPSTITALALGGVLLVGLLVVEHRTPQPIVPLSLFSSRTRAPAYLNLLLVAATLTSMWFFLTQFLQGPLELDPLQTGLAFLPMAAAVFFASQLVPRLLTRIATKPVAVTGLALFAAATVWLSFLAESSSYVTAVLGPLILLGTGTGLAMVAHNLIIISATPPEESGAATGALQAMLTLGGSIGLAVLVTVFESARRTDNPEPRSVTFSDGLSATFTVASGFALAALLIATVLFRRPKTTQPAS